MGSSLLHRRVYMRQAYAIAAWGEIIYRVDMVCYSKNTSFFHVYGW